MKASTKASGLAKKKWKPGKHKNNKMKKTNRQNKLHVKFDKEDRRAYLTGFQKRKRERKEKAFKKLQQDIKDEMKQIKRERKDIVKKMIQQSKELMEHGGIGVIDDDDDEEEEEEINKNKVTVSCGSATVEISDLDLTSRHHIGVNQMEADTGDTKKDKAEEKKEDQQEEEEEEEEEDVSPKNLDRLGIHSQRDLQRSLKKSSAMAIKRSNLMRQKQQRDATKQKKAQARKNNHRRKLKAKKMRHRRSAKSE